EVEDATKVELLPKEIITASDEWRETAITIQVPLYGLSRTMSLVTVANLVVKEECFINKLGSKFHYSEVCLAAAETSYSEKWAHCAEFDVARTSLRTV
ncbi:hypothetical protein HAX54_027897, partial [Datura stramonium]|nr:hypothetical protein [Datura stramonium]